MYFITGLIVEENGEERSDMGFKTVNLDRIYSLSRCLSQGSVVASGESMKLEANPGTK